MGGTVGAIALNPMGTQATGKGTVTIKDILATLSNNNQLAGGISGNLKLTDKSGKLQNLMDRKEAPDGLTFGNRLEKLVSRIAFGGKNRQTFTTKGVSFPSTKNSDSSVEQGIKTSLTNAYTGIIPNVASQLASSVGLPTAIGAFNQNVIKSIEKSFIINELLFFISLNDYFIKPSVAVFLILLFFLKTPPSKPESPIVSTFFLFA
jgi:hypothetical protein